MPFSDEDNQFTILILKKTGLDLFNYSTAVLACSSTSIDFMREQRNKCLRVLAAFYYLTDTDLANVGQGNRRWGNPQVTILKINIICGKSSQQKYSMHHV